MPPVSTIVRSAEDRDREVRAVEDAASSRIIATVLRYRARMFPAPIILAGALVWLGPSVWRYSLLAFAVISIATLGFIDRLARSGAGAARDLLLPAWIAGLAQLAIVFVMGGIGGPVAAAIPLISVFMNLVAPGRQAVYFVALVQLPAVWSGRSRSRTRTTWCPTWCPRPGTVSTLRPAPRAWARGSPRGS